MEDAELLLLVLATVLLVRESLRRSSLSPALGIAAYLYLVLCLRELDLRNTAAPHWLVWYSGKGRYEWLIALGCLVVGNAWPQRRRIVRALRGEDWRAGWRVFAMCFLLYVLSLLVTRKAIVRVHATREFFEEACELPMELGFFLLARLLVGKGKAARERAAG